ncbi:MAG: LexA family protein [Succinivibrio sp.]
MSLFMNNLRLEELKVLNEGPLADQDLNFFLGMESPAVYLFSCSSNAMSGDGILKGDVLVCTRGRQVQSGDIIIIAVNGRFLVRRFIDGKYPYLESSNPDFLRIDLSKVEEPEVFGVVTGMIRKTKRVDVKSEIKNVRTKSK